MITATILQFVAAMCAYGVERILPVPDQTVRTAINEAVQEAIEANEAMAEKLERRAARAKLTQAERLRKESQKMKSNQNKRRKKSKQHTADEE
jgi:glutamine phosphoribosylpyrophosphate amidotransferase